MSGVDSAEPAAPVSPGTGHDPLVVYYDGACPLCTREIGFYKCQEGADQLLWVDVSAIEGANVAPDLRREQALARLTVRDEDGRLVSGSGAFIRIWLRLPRFRWLARLFQVPPFPWLLHQAYEIFLLVRPYLQAMVPPAKTAGRR